MNKDVSRSQMICGEAFGLVNGFVLDLERVCEKHTYSNDFDDGERDGSPDYAHLHPTHPE